MFNDKNQDYFNSYDIPFIKKDGKLWFCDKSLPIYSFDIKTKTTKTYNVNDFPDYLPDEQGASLRLRANVEIVEHRGDFYTFHNRRSHHFQILRQGAQQFDPFLIVPKGFQASGIYKDSLGQLLFTYYKTGNIKSQGAVLMDKNGKQWDYSSMIKKLPPVYAFRGNNF